MTGASGSGWGYVIGYPQQYPDYALLPDSAGRKQIRKRYVAWSVFRYFSAAICLVCLAILCFMLYPRQPDVEVLKISLENISLNMDDTPSIIPSVNLDVSLSIRLQISNPNFFGVEYDKLVVQFYYRGDNLGKVESVGGEIPSRRAVNATAIVALLGTKILNHANELIADVYNRKVPLQTQANFQGAVEMFFMRPRINMTVCCDLVIEPVDRTVLSKSCALCF